MFVFFIILTILAFSSIQFISPIPKTTQLDYHCNYNVADLQFCPTSLDHCAADLLLDNSNENDTKEYVFDVSFAPLKYSVMISEFDIRILMTNLDNND